MRQKRPPTMRGSVTQNNLSVRMRAEEPSRVRLLARLGLVFAGFVVLTGVFIWLWHSGRLNHYGQALREHINTATQKADFAVTDIRVEGRHRAAKEDIFDALGTERGAPLFAFDPDTAATRLGKLPWVEKVTVERRLPDTIRVNVTEREPAARWQHDEKIYVIDDRGHVLPTAVLSEFPALPLVVGMGANDHCHELFAALKPYPALFEKLESAVRVGERRWDLHLNPKITVRLPEEDMAGALHRLSVLMTQDHVLDRELIAIDLRVPDRLVIDPVPAAAPPVTPKHTGGPHP